MAGDRFNAYSAGTLPRSALNPTALHVLKTKGHDISPLHAKHINAFQTSDAPLMDFVFTVCDRAANEDCPTWAGQPISGHWGMPDPARVDGTEAQKQLAFHQTYGAFHNRISIFCALPLDELDRPSQQRHVDDIAKQSATKE
ncbi:UNVERIFIED_CONTAM: hypothetical protein GTU68_037393 [Idotea baltica]|nr:hypothetical protein [Idotea baltica]